MVFNSVILFFNQKGISELHKTLIGKLLKNSFSLDKIYLIQNYAAFFNKVLRMV